MVEERKTKNSHLIFAATCRFLGGILFTYAIWKSYVAIGAYVYLSRRWNLRLILTECFDCLSEEVIPNLLMVCRIDPILLVNVTI